MKGLFEIRELSRIPTGQFRALSPDVSLHRSPSIIEPFSLSLYSQPGNDGAGICDLEHCGTSLCGAAAAGGTAASSKSGTTEEQPESEQCRVETSALPFHIRVAFGPGEDTGTSPEDNVGMCLSYEQLACVP